MEKDFDAWNSKKKLLNDSSGTAFFQEREVWWCSLGINIGYEQDGSESDFERPVLIIKKYNLDSCLTIPLTASSKEGKYYFKIGTIADRKSTAILSQIRFTDRKRLSNKICTLKETVFASIIDKLVKVNFTI